MCGRFTLRTPPDAWVKTLGLDRTPNIPPRYNIAPAQEAPVVRQRQDTRARELALLRWGLILPWSDGPDSGYSMINARATVVRHARHITFQMAEVAVSRQMFRQILSLIARLRAPPAPA